MTRTIPLLAASLCLLALARPLAAAPPDAKELERNPRTVYFTVGDYQDMLFTPLDSRASIEAAFDVLKNKYGVRRVWWRGGQDEVWGKQFEIREQSRRYARLWDWWKDLQYRVVDTNAIAVQAGRGRGIEVWMAYGLFDNGSQPDAGFGGFPYAAEDRIRIEHPEWAPVNKYGTWRQGGPIEFAYPAARKAMVDYLAKHTVDGGYDGIAFLSYVENYSQRYEDEFGYSQPIVDEFKRRHGVDIRTQPFDRAAWAKLRGEYLTQFMRELHAALAKHGKKIAVSVDGIDPHLPCLWNVEGGVRTVGRLWMDVETWAKEGIVDEINLYYPNTPESMAAAMAVCKGTPAKVSVFGRTRGDLPAGAERIMTVNTDLESGFDWDHYVDWDDENIPPQPPEALESDDVYARRRILTAIHKGKQKASVADVTPLLKDDDIYVRRAALRAVAALKDRSAVPAVGACLKDPENGVRWLAAVVLGQLHAPNAVKTILDAVAGEAGTYQFNFVVAPAVLRDLKKDGKLTDADVQLLVTRTADRNDKVREVAWNLIRSLGLADVPNLEAAALRALKEDQNPYARELALAAMLNIPPRPHVLAAVTAAMRGDADPVVQARAAAALASLARSDGTKPVREQAVKDLVAHFRQYGTGTTRADKDWGWRETGNGLRILAEDGDAALRQLMSQKQDQRLADLAWRVLYLKQEDRFCFVTEEEDRAAHAKHPFLKFESAAAASARD